ncbi:FAD-binding oxidoreductase [Burkholderia sp. Bp9142]|uniref:NAD(P)/FAD-dependent oxidoreductase n=1 Tax=Burkholderia sp. Bp9142 TaxID=2184573 RepID=UPI000F58F6BA|nr:FAD-binding oxidoreductase [Burkholderia sp. Bp9142]RQR24030.1 FAD-binding oxidoreductase [Burkholderia sp. Bp9142]
MEEVIVIGAGVIGCSAALNLARLGFRVHVVDGSTPGSGCSFGNAGIIAVDHVAPLASPQTVAGIPRMLFQPNGPLRLNARGLPRMASWMLAFAAQSMPSSYRRNTEALASLVTAAAPAWQRLIQSRVLPYDLYRDIGSLYVFERPEKPEARRRHLEILDRYHVDYTELSADRVRAEYLPGLTRAISHARYFPGMASVANPLRVVHTLFDAARSAGATFAQAHVAHVEPLPDGRVGVHAGGNVMAANKVLIAAGARSAELTGKLGTTIPLTSERGYHVDLHEPAADCLRVPVSFVERGFTCNPMENGIRLAGTVELGADDGPDWKRADMLVSQFASLFPDLNSPRMSSRWYGDRPTLPDYLPMIDALPTARNVFVATGHQHLGLTLAPLTGELVAQLIAGNATSIDLNPFGANRFKR